MKIAKTLAGIYLTRPDIRQSIFDGHIEERKHEYPNADWENDPDLKRKQGFAEKAILGSASKVYAIQQTALDVCQKINIKEDKTFDYLTNIPDGHRVFITGSDTFLKIYKEGNWIICVSMKRTEGERVSFCMFMFDLGSEITFIGKDEYSEYSERLLLQVLIFITYTDYDEIILAPNQKTGTKKTGNTLNDAPFNVTIVNSNWNKVVVRQEGFTVNGFLRLQACGQGWKDRKLVWIEPFVKQGYKRHYR